MRPTLAPPPPGLIQPAPAPSFSVVIAAHNAADTIAEAVASAIAQTLRAKEVVVCDDGSDDDFESAVAPFRPQITTVHQPNLGEGAAKNSGVSQASGDFVVFLDADDT